MDFDSVEDTIRGEELLRDAERKKDEEARKIKKELEKKEVERRLQELKKKIK